MSAPDYIPEMDLEEVPDRFRPPPHALWHEDGTLACPACGRVARLTSYVLQTALTRACYGCMVHRGLSATLSLSLSRVFQAASGGWVPTDPRASASFPMMAQDECLERLLRAVEVRLFLTPEEARPDGSSLAGYVRRLTIPARWLVDPSLPPEARPPDWLRPILHTLLSRP